MRSSRRRRRRDAIVDKINADVNEALRDPEMQKAPRRISRPSRSAARRRRPPLISRRDRALEDRHHVGPCDARLDRGAKIEMRRREFIAMLGGAALLRPRAACAQPSSKLPIVGVLGLATPEIWRPWIAAFLQRLGERGWIDGRTVAIEYRWTQGSSEHLPEIAAEFVRLNPAVIVTTAPAVAALKQLTSTIPIVFALANDPVGGGMVAKFRATRRQYHGTIDPGDRSGEQTG